MYYWLTPKSEAFKGVTVFPLSSPYCGIGAEHMKKHVVLQM